VMWSAQRGKNSGILQVRTQFEKCLPEILRGLHVSQQSCDQVHVFLLTGARKIRVNNHFIYSENGDSSPNNATLGCFFTQMRSVRNNGRWNRNEQPVHIV